MIYIKPEEAHYLIENPKSRLGEFYTIENNMYVGISNLNGDCFCEDFETLEMCEKWHKSEMSVEEVKESFKKCHHCGTHIEWEGSTHEHGSIWHCENGNCEHFVCEKCTIEKTGIANITDQEIIMCIDCLGSGGES